MFLTKLINWFKTHKAIIGLVVLVAVIFIRNYTPGTRLSGWDSLQTDLNPLLGVKRAFFSVWEEYQSMGLTAGMAHGADLIRALLVWLMSFVLPSQILRYTFQVLMLLVGALGMRKLLVLSGFGKKYALIPLAGAIFYILNFCVIQMLYMPFEPFNVFFAMLPWEVWVFLTLFKSGDRVSRRTYLFFILINILATPQSVAQQLFVVYMLLLGCLTLGLIITTRAWYVVRRGLLAALIIILINSFWIFPQVYFLKDAGSVVEQAKIDQLSTQDIFYSNKDMGDITSFVRSEGFFYNRLDQNKQPLFLPWMNYRNSLPVAVVIYIVALIWIIGLLRRSPYRLSFILGLFLVGFFLLTNTFPISSLNALIRQDIPFINQIFRSPFTKFSIPLAFVTAYFFASGMILILEQTERRFKRWSIALPLATGLLFALPLIQALPVFNGHLFAKEMQVTIPQDYFQTMAYFEGVNKNARIGLLPEYTFWGWYNTEWGYDGSGFLWYGIEQPMISRTFDVWSLTSESYYWELQQALESQDVEKLQNVLDKYQVDYLIFDHSLNPIVGTSKSIQYGSTEALLARDVRIREVKVFGDITIYRVTHPGKTTNFVSLTQNMPNIGPQLSLTSEDTAYETQGEYMTDPGRSYDTYYPFLGVLGQTDLLTKTWHAAEAATTWTFSEKLPANTKNMLPATASATLTMDLYENNTAVHYVLPVHITKTKNTLHVSFPKLLLSNFQGAASKAENCSQSSTLGQVTGKQNQNGITVTSSGGAVGCLHFDAPFLDQRYGYIVTVRSKNISGAGLFFYALDDTNEQPYIEDYLTGSPTYYVLGPLYNEGLGYSFNFQNQSYPHIPTVNSLSEVDAYFMPYDLLKQLTLTNPKTHIPETSTLNGFEAQKINYYTYHVEVTSKKSNLTLVLGQSYDKGWHAYQMPTLLAKFLPILFGKELSGHVKVNNWENGWVLPQEHEGENITLVFLPQYFEYLGLILIPVSITLLFVLYYLHDYS